MKIPRPMVLTDREALQVEKWAINPGPKDLKVYNLGTTLERTLRTMSDEIFITDESVIDLIVI